MLYWRKGTLSQHFVTRVVPPLAVTPTPRFYSMERCPLARAGTLKCTTPTKRVLVSQATVYSSNPYNLRGQREKKVYSPPLEAEYRLGVLRILQEAPRIETSLEMPLAGVSQLLANRLLSAISTYIAESSTKEEEWV